MRYDPKAGHRTLDLLRWWLIPYWAKDIKIGFSTINAMADIVLSPHHVEQMALGLVDLFEDHIVEPNEPARPPGSPLAAHDDPTSPPQVECRLTDLGHSMSEPVLAFGRWVQEHLAEVDAARERFDQRAKSEKRLVDAMPKVSPVPFGEGDQIFEAQPPA